jgi:hypothetical protein
MSVRRVVHAKHLTLVLATENNSAIRYTQTQHPSELLALAQHHANPMCRRFVVPLKRVYFGEDVRLDSVLPADALKRKALGPDGKEAQIVATRIGNGKGKKRLILVTPLYDLDASQLDPKAHAVWAKGITPRRLLLDYLSQCASSPDITYIQDDFQPRNIVMKRQARSGNTTLYGDLRMIDFGKVTKLRKGKRGQQIEKARKEIHRLYKK